MNINDFRFYRKNNRYYFESSLLEGRVIIKQHTVDTIVIENGYADENEQIAIINLFIDNIDAVLGAEAV